MPACGCGAEGAVLRGARNGGHHLPAQPLSRHVERRGDSHRHPRRPAAGEPLMTRWLLLLGASIVLGGCPAYVVLPPEQIPMQSDPDWVIVSEPRPEPERDPQPRSPARAAPDPGGSRLPDDRAHASGLPRRDATAGERRDRPEGRRQGCPSSRTSSSRRRSCSASGAGSSTGSRSPRRPGYRSRCSARPATPNSSRSRTPHATWLTRSPPGRYGRSGRRGGQKSLQGFGGRVNGMRQRRRRPSRRASRAALRSAALSDGVSRGR